MKKLQFNNSFKNFLYDLNYFITIYEDNLHIFNYNKLIHLSDEEIILLIDNKIVSIKGNKLIIKKMTNKEMLINGNLMKVEFKYET